MYKSFSAVFWIPQYFYDPFGKLLSVKNAVGNAITSSTHIANINPLRYRGYYYDTETGFYYLQSRYYDPIVCRFINADSYASTGQGFVGCNMFAYCENNPANRKDAIGKRSIVATDEDAVVYQQGMILIRASVSWSCGAGNDWESYYCNINFDEEGTSFDIVLYTPTGGVHTMTGEYSDCGTKSSPKLYIKTGKEAWRNGVFTKASEYSVSRSFLIDPKNNIAITIMFTMHFMAQPSVNDGVPQGEGISPHSQLLDGLGQGISELLGGNSIFDRVSLFLQ